MSHHGLYTPKCNPLYNPQVYQELADYLEIERPGVLSQAVIEQRDRSSAPSPQSRSQNYSPLREDLLSQPAAAYSLATPLLNVMARGSPQGGQ